VFDLQRDNAIPTGPKGYGGDERFRPTGRRMWAIEEVLCRLPGEQYEIWRACIRDVAWFIPDKELWGQVDQFPNKNIIYLSPILEFVQSDAAIAGLVVHEIAHVILDHIGAKLTYDEKEQQVYQAVREWGFAEESDAADKELFGFFSKPQQADESPEA
jgi:hypothetical protein